MSAASTSSTSGEPGSRISPLGRVFGVFFKPRETFEDIARRPTWVLPTVLLSVLALGLSLLFTQKVDLASYLRNQADQNAKFAQLPQDRQDETLHSRVVLARYSLGLNVLVPGLLIGVVACFYWLAVNAASGAGLRYATVAGVVAHGLMPWGLLEVVALILLALKPPGMLDSQNLVKTSLGAYLPAGSPAWLVSLGGSLELFWIWSLVLIAIGLWTANPRKISKAAAFGTVFGLWLVWIIARVGWTAFFGT